MQILETGRGQAHREAVRRFIVDGIARGEFARGAKLPTERALATQFDLPRGAVRECLTVMEAEGLIVREIGRGTFVAGTPEPAEPRLPARAAPDASPAQLIEARLALEPPLLGVAAKNATRADLREIADWHGRGVAARDLAEFHLCDRALHLAIARATRNDLLIAAAEHIDLARDSGEWDSLKGRGHALRPQRRRAVDAEHEAIVSALVERDAPGAERAMVAHLIQVRLNLLGY